MAREVDTPITVITQRNLSLEQDMRFLFNGQPYRVTFVDNLSTDGTTILGMYDDILQDGDDVENNIANYNRRYELRLNFDSDVILEVGKPFEVNYEVFKMERLQIKRHCINCRRSKRCFYNRKCYNSSYR